MTFKTLLSDINNVALAMESLKNITQFNTGSTIANGEALSNVAIEQYKASIDGLNLSQAQAALSATALNDAQKQQILTSAGLLENTQAITLEEVKQMASSATLSAQKKEEILATLQGAYSEGQWNIERLEAIASGEGEAAAIAQTILAKKAENVENVKNIAGRKALTASLKQELAARIALMASNPVTWIVGIAAVSVGLIALQKKFSKSLEECTEDLKTYNSEFDNAQSSIESLESELSTCRIRLEELQKLADNGSISIIEQEEYERLQKTNDELERNLKIEREKAQLNAIDGAKTADETINKTVQSNYVHGTIEGDMGGTIDTMLHITPKEELEASIAEYNRLQSEIDKLNKSYDNGSISSEDYTLQLNSLTDAQTKARTRASEMSDILIECEQSYNNLENTGVKFTTTSQQNYDSVKLANQEYSNFLDTINDVNDSFDKLDTGEKAQTLKNKYAQKTLQLDNGQGSYTVEDKKISDWIDGLSDDDLSVLATINFSGEQTKESMQEALDYAKTHTDAEVIETPISFGLNSDNVSTTMQGLEKIKSLYTQFAKAKEQLSSDSSTKLSFEIQDIEGIKDSLMDANKQLLVSEEEFSNFETILADQSSTAQQIQDAFDSLATAYVNNALEQGNYTDETKELIKTQLELQGATAESADAFVEQQVKISEAYKAIQDAGFTAINIPSEEITKMEQLGIVTAETAEQMRLLAIQEQIKNGTTLNTVTDCQNLLALASDAGLTTEVIQKLIQLIDIYTSVESNAYGQGTQDRAMALEKARQLTNEISDLITNGSEKTKLDLANMTGGKSGAGSAGKEAADAYLEAFEKELGDLDDLKDRGVISEKEYLDRLRELYQRYFKDKEKYVDQYQKYEKKYLDGMYSLYNSALSGITKLMGKQIDKYSEEKEAAVSSLEEERDARLAVIDAQKEQLQSQIDLIDKEIDAKEKEKKAIQDAYETRKRELDLQKAQYDLERARNQRTILQYSEQKGMHYVKDDSAERDAKEKVDDAKREIQIAAIEKEIDLLNEKKDLIQEQIDLLDKQADEVESYYSKMIESTEKYYDSLIKSMENQKSKWEELADIKEVADAYSAVQQVFGDLGYTVEDVLSGNEQAFEDFRNKYIALMNDMNSNSSFGDGLSYATGKAKEDLGSFLDSTNEVADGLDNLSEKSSAVDGIATSLGNASTSASELSTNTNGLSDNLNGISDSLNNFPTEDKFSGLTTQFTELGKAIGEVAKALGIDGEGSVNSLVAALSGVSEISLGDEQTGVIAQFNALASAVNAVSSAINGTGGGASSDPQDSKSQSMSAGATGTSGSITSALDELKSKADEVLGTGGGEDSGGEGTIGQFEQLEQAVKDVSSAIGSGCGEGEESGSKSNGEEDADNLIGAITSLGEQSEETLGESGGEGVIGRFEQFRDVISEANEHVTGISDGLDAIDGKEVECTIKINIESNGSIPHFAEGTVLGNMNLDSAEYKAKYGSAHVTGTANVQGNWGVREAGKSLVGEEGQELWVHRGTGKFETVGDRGAEFINVQKGDLIFNHEQTKQLLRDGQISSRGKAYANGTVNKPSVLDRLRAQGYEVQKYEWKDMYGNLISPQQMNEAAKAWVSGTYECLTPMNDFKEKIKETVKVIEGANVVNNTMNQQPINVTMGDIHLHEVQDVDGLSKAIIHQMPGKMLQAIHQK